jgi:exodeoxyribonuclease-5
MDKANLIAKSYPFEPTAEQLVFCDKVTAFLRSEETHKCFVLRGYAIGANWKGGQSN